MEFVNTRGLSGQGDELFMSLNDKYGKARIRIENAETPIVKDTIRAITIKE